LRKTLLFLFACFMAFTANAFAGWSIPRLITEPSGGDFPQIISRGDTLHVVYQNGRQYDKICYIRSTDAGDTWTQRQILSSRDGEIIWPKILIWNQRLLVLWRTQFYSGLYRFNIAEATSSDAGSSWINSSYLFDSNREHLAGFSVSGYDSLLNLNFSSSAGDSMVFYNIRSMNFGVDWSLPIQLFSTGFTSLTDQVSYGVAVHFVWPGYFNQNTDEETYYLRSTDGGLSWGENLAISSLDGYSSYFPSICVNESGNILISWMDYKYSPNITSGDIFLRMSIDTGVVWLPEQQITFNHYAMWSDIIASNDTIFISYEDIQPENGWRGIYCISSFDAGENWNEPIRLDHNEFDSRNPALSMSDGKIYIIWQESNDNPDSCGIMFCRWASDPDAIVGESDQQPHEFSFSAYPNPFNSATTITLTGAEQAEIGIYDITGRLITTLHTDGGQALWDAGAYSSGLYFARLAGEKVTALKLILLR
jgi:hypothetical protein